MEILEWILLMLTAGAAAGFIAGLAGIGGGMLLVPALYFIYQNMNLSDDGVMHLAIGTSLCIMVATSISAITSHHKQGDIIWPIFWKVLPGLVVGVVAGAILAHFLPNRTLALIFGVILVVVSLTMITGLAESAGRKDLPPNKIMASVGVVIGFKSGLLGVGGGAMSVPFPQLVWAPGGKDQRHQFDVYVPSGGRRNCCLHDLRHHREDRRSVDDRIRLLASGSDCCRGDGDPGTTGHEGVAPHFPAGNANRLRGLPPVAGHQDDHGVGIGNFNRPAIS